MALVITRICTIVDDH